jgi:peptidoglycan/LPS O-acetylase OafA/YrhL
MATHIAGATLDKGILVEPSPVHRRSPAPPALDVTQAHRRLDVQGLRAVAIILVVAYHAGLPVPGGFIGVDVFFVISGYVIIAMLYREVERTGRISFSAFFTRRVRRIMPALALLTTVTCLGAWFLLNPLGGQQVTGDTAGGATLFVANWVIRWLSGDYFNEAAGMNPLLHTWSLSVEEQFYMVFPALLALVWVFAMRRRSSGRTAAMTLLVGIAVVSFGGALLFTGPAASGSASALSWAFYGSVFRAWEFAIGGFIAVAVRRGPRLPKEAIAFLGLLGMVMIGYGAFGMNLMTPTPGPLTLVPVLGTGLVIYAGTGTLRGVVPGLSSRPMVRIGDLSYSWYLWHWPIIVFTALWFPGQWLLVMAAAAFSIVPAWLSFTRLEEPVRRSGWRGRRVVALAAVCMVVPIVASVMLIRHADDIVADVRQSIASEQPRHVGVLDSTPPQDSLFAAAVQAQQGQWDVFGRPCLNGSADAAIGSCRFFTGAGKPRAVLVGDSHAGAYAAGFLHATKDLGYQTEVITTAACAFTDLPIGRGGAVDRQCVQRNREILQYLTDDPPDVLAIANRSPQYVAAQDSLDDQFGGGHPCVLGADGGCLDHATAVQAWGDSLRRTADALEPWGTDLLVLQTAPEQLNGLDSCIFGTTVRLHCLQTPRSVSWERRKDVVRAEASAAADAGFSVYDPFNFFCDEDVCRQYIDGRFLYRNDDHLNPWGSEVLAGAIEKKLEAMR